jgi:predicted O-methyltransferase YrrM
VGIDNETFQNVYNETLEKTDFAEEKRIILRGKTTEVINQIPNESLDFAYIDGDHTLKGIAIDLINVYPKIKDGGWIGGDDFCKSIWQHPTILSPLLFFRLQSISQKQYLPKFLHYLTISS